MDRPLTYRDLTGAKKDVTWDDVFKSAKRIKRFSEALRKRYFERDELVNAICFALMIREHVIIDGPTGTAKTDVADTIARGIKGAKTWSMDLSKYMSEPHIFGDIDVKEAGNTGKIRHLIEGSLIDSHIANIGEFFDANGALLRAMLRVLNERKFVRGPQRVDASLLSAIANTNFDPIEQSRSRPELQAVVDRFLFRVHVGYVKEPTNRLRMLEAYLDRDRDEPLPDVSIDDVVLVSGVVVDNNLIGDTLVQQAYEELTRVFGKNRGQPVSDRRFLKAAQIMEASSLLRQSARVGFEDLESTGYILIESGRDAEPFDKAFSEVVGKWKSEDRERSLRTELDVIESFEKKIPDSSTFPNINIETAVDMFKMLRMQHGDLKKIAMSLPTSERKQAEVLSNMEVVMTELQGRIGL